MELQSNREKRKGSLTRKVRNNRTYTSAQDDLTEDKPGVFNKVNSFMNNIRNLGQGIFVSNVLSSSS